MRLLLLYYFFSFLLPCQTKLVVSLLPLLLLVLVLLHPVMCSSVLVFEMALVLADNFLLFLEHIFQPFVGLTLVFDLDVRGLKQLSIDILLQEHPILLLGILLHQDCLLTLLLFY